MTSPDFGQDPALLPADEHDRELIRQVRPSGWTNPTPRDRYHLVIIGAGTAGLVTASAAATLGARVALVEKRLMGGDCLNFGCVPSKALIRSARSWHEARRSGVDFGGPSASGEGSFPEVMDRVRRLRAAISHHDSAERFTDLGVDVFFGEARFVGRKTVRIDGGRTRFHRAVIATGSHPAEPPIPGLDQTPFLTNETVFSLRELPRRLAIIGAGAVGCELAQCFARFGSQVTVFDIAERAMAADDPEAASIVQTSLERDGVTFRFGVEIDQVSTAGNAIAVHAGDDVWRAEALLVAAGRRPNLGGLDLKRAAVAVASGRLLVDDRLRTTNRRIYAIGDVASEHQFTHIADAQARLAVQNSLFFGRGRASKLVVPWCTYTSPEVAQVGLTLEQAERDGIAIDTLKLPLTEVDRAVLDGATEGFLKVHLKRGNDRILGATLVADNAGDIIGELAMAITNEVGLNKISATIHPYPTQAEIVRKIADRWRRRKLTPLVRRAFDLYFRLIR